MVSTSNLYVQAANLVLSPWQSKVWEDKHRYVVVNAGRRAGKTYMVAWRLFDFATKHDKSIAWYVAPTYRQAKNILWEQLISLIPTPVIEKKNETELKVTLINGSQIHVKGAEDPDTLRGVRVDFIVFDEAAFIDRWDSVWNIIRPTLIDSKGSAWFISTPNGFNHFKRLAENYTKDDTYSYHLASSYDNPYLPKDEIEATKKEYLSQDQEDAFYQEIMGEFRKMSGLIYKSFDRKTHMVDIPDIEYNYTYMKSLDFGFGHKSALLYFAANSTGTEIYCYDGLYQSGLTEKEIAEVSKIKDGNRYISSAVADSAQPMTIAELANYGVYFTPIEKGPDSVRSGIAQVAELLKVRKDTGRPTLMFNKHLTWIADEFEKYRWIQSKTDGILRDIPYKVMDDAMDAVRYFAMSFGGQEETYKRNDFSSWKIQ